MRTLGYIASFFVVLVLFPSTSHAQLLDNLNSVEITLSPEYPKPGQIVQASVFLASENVRTATIVWLLDDEIQQEGAGDDTFRFVAGGVGVPQALGVLVKMPSGQVFAKTLRVIPAEVTLVWEADTYTPPFYKGRSLYSSGSIIRAEAIPNFVDEEGRVYTSPELLYTWSKNGTVLGKMSGIASNAIVVEGPKFFGNFILSVEVSTPDGTQISQSAARIETVDPVIKVYERDPLVGVLYHNAIGSGYSFSGTSQFEVQAEPYFMDTPYPNNDSLRYSWSINGSKVSSIDARPSALLVQLLEEAPVTTTLRVVVDHARHLLQTGESTSEVSFESSARSSLFGF
ncbi:hypothetical protein CL652_00645 [bacterium]|nr:hypothetical protein [bacterium]|tara:strand:- start:1935 stop:2960 length:1026 start_codon:yes stop_codon:yes gene_type:complete